MKKQLKEIKVGNQTYKIKFVKKLYSGRAWGNINIIKTDPEGIMKGEGDTIKIVRREGWEETLFHELTHAIFFVLFKKLPNSRLLTKLCGDEKLVDELSKLIYEVSEEWKKN